MSNLSRSENKERQREFEQDLDVVSSLVSNYSAILLTRLAGRIKMGFWSAPSWSRWLTLGISCTPSIRSGQRLLSTWCEPGLTVLQAYVLFIQCDANGDHELESAELEDCCNTLARVS